MKVQDLRDTLTELEQQYNNLSNPEWVVGQLRNLQGRYDIIKELIKQLEEDEQNATETTRPTGTQSASKRSDNSGK